MRGCLGDRSGKFESLHHSHELRAVEPRGRHWRDWEALAKSHSGGVLRRCPKLPPPIFGHLRGTVWSRSCAGLWLKLFADHTSGRSARRGSLWRRAVRATLHGAAVRRLIMVTCILQLVAKIKGKFWHHRHTGPATRLVACQFRSRSHAADAGNAVTVPIAVSAAPALAAARGWRCRRRASAFLVATRIVGQAIGLERLSNESRLPRNDNVQRWFASLKHHHYWKQQNKASQPPFDTALFRLRRIVNACHGSSNR